MGAQYRSTGAIVVALALACTMIATWLVNQPVRFPLDDAYITIANAELLLTGAVDSYGQTRPTGATSLLHLLLLTAFGAVLDWPIASLALSMLAAVLYASGLYLALRTTGVHPLLVVLGTITGFLGFQAWFQLMNGLETGWAMAAVAWAVYLAQHPDDDRRQHWLAVLIGVMPFIRPELAILSAMLALAAAIRLYRKPARLAKSALLTLGAAAIMAGLALATTGELLPQTGGAKVAFFADAGRTLAQRFMILASVLAATPLGVLLVGMVALPMFRDGWAFGGFAVLFLVASGFSLPSGLMHNEMRYLYVLVPLALVGWAALACRKDVLRGKAWPVLALAAAVAIGGFFGSGWGFYRQTLNDPADQEALVVWARSHLPPDARILIHDAGYFGWQTDFALVDVVGLKSPDSIAAHRRWTLPSAGRDRGRAVAQIALRAKVTHAIILDRPFWGDIAGHLRKAGWTLVPLRAGATTLYHVYRLAPPGQPSPTPDAP